MEVLSAATTTSGTQSSAIKRNNSTFTLSNQYHRFSSLSLASAANSEDNYSLAESFHTCYDDPAVDEQDLTMTACLENVIMEDDDHHDVTALHHSTKNSKLLLNNHHGIKSPAPLSHAAPSPPSGGPPHSIVPLKAYTQLQQQPLSPRLTAARLALSSDIGVLRRSMNDQTPANNNTASSSSTPKQLAKVLMDRDHMMTSGAFPMSRSFATPRMAVGTAFRTSVSGSSLSSLYTASSSATGMMFGCPKDGEEKKEEEFLAPPPFLTAASSSTTATTIASSSASSAKVHRKKRSKKIKKKPLELEDLADELQVQILSFVPLQDVRSVMATNRRYRKLLFTQDAQNLWQLWCTSYQWPQLPTTTNAMPMPTLDNSSGRKNKNNGRVILIDDLSLPTAARPPSPSSRKSQMVQPMSSWHQQANLSLLLSMAQSQPTDIDQAQLNQYQTWRYANVSSGSRRRRSRHRVHTTDGNQQPLLHYELVNNSNGTSGNDQQWMVHFSGRVGQGDRCVRSNRPWPRPTKIAKKEWMVPPQTQKLLLATGNHKNSDYNHHHGTGGSIRGGSHGHGHGLLDLFCRSTRAVAPPRPAWRPFVAPFCTQDKATVHLTPRFVSYFEVSIMAPPNTTEQDEEARRRRNASTHVKDCVAVGVATDSFDWHTRMPGWDAASFGYHGDDGGIFHSSGGMLREFGPSFGRGDVVGCGIDHVMRGIFYTLNGQFLGYAWTELPMEILERDMYPVVGIDTNDYIHCNFGTEPFKYDLASMVVRHEEFVHQSLSFSSAATP